MKIDDASEIIETIISKLGITLDSVDIEERSPNDFYINIFSEQYASLLIGRNGETLMSLQHLLKSIFRSQGILEEGDHVKVDVDSYRMKQESSILNLVDSRAQQVIESGRDTVLPPMSSFFRRLVHLHVKENYPVLNTFSSGDRDHRAVCISANDPASAEQAPSDLYAELDF